MERKWVVAGWAAAAAVAVAAGIGAVALAQGGSLSPTEPMSEEQVQSALDEALSATPSSSPSAESSPSASPSPDASEPVPTGQVEEVPDGGAGSGEEVFSGDGGTFLARCSGARIELVWWSAAQGWQVSSVDAGPGEDVEIEFEGAGEEEYTAACVDGRPQLNAQSDDDDDD